MIRIFWPIGFLEAYGVPLIYSLIGEVEDAFTVKVPVLDAFSILHPSNLPEDIAEITDYGQVWYNTILKWQKHKFQPVAKKSNHVLTYDLQIFIYIYFSD